MNSRRKSHSKFQSAVVQVLESRQLLTVPPLDTVIFGNTTSESAHSLTQNSSQIITGGLSEPARQLLPIDAANNPYGGDMTFTVAVDPVKRTYFSAKFWGNDDTNIDKGRLYLYVPDSNFNSGSTINWMVGYEHEGDYVPLNVTTDTPGVPGRFFYDTTMLPLWMTKGRTSLQVKIVSTGRFYAFGSGGPPTGNMQFPMNTNSRGIYRAYTHTDPMLNPTGEAQGTTPTGTTAPASVTESILAPGGSFYNGVNSNILGQLNTATSVANFAPSEVEFLAQSYSTQGSSANPLVGWHNYAVVAKVIDVIDAYATDYFTTPGNASSGGNAGWGGYYGALGWAIHLLSPQLQSCLDDVVNYGTAGGNRTRRDAWGTMLQASRDFGRFNRRTLTNQNSIADASIYKANRGMIDISDSDAFSEESAQRYLKEAMGILPWLGSDLPNGGHAYTYGRNYYQVTPDGLTREWGFVGFGYGEMQISCANFYAMTGNTVFRDQAIKMEKARAPFRRPNVDTSGYRIMQTAGVLAWRGVWESDGEGLSTEITYGDRTAGDVALRTAAVTLDPTAIGYAKQMFADNQYFKTLTNNNNTDALNVFADYQAVKTAIDSGSRLPMTDGQPDFVWSDEVSGITAIKHGAERLWIEPYWQSSYGRGVNGVARFEYSNSQYEQIGVMQSNPQFDYAGAYAVQSNSAGAFTLPDSPLAAYAGERTPIASIPASTEDPTPFTGKWNFSAVRFGNYLLGLNATDTNSYTLKTPVGFTSANDLVTGISKSGAITVAPNSTVVLYLPDFQDNSPVPNAPLLVTSSVAGSQITLNWTSASGAVTYNVKRSSVAGGPYTTLSSGITSTSYLDTTTSAGATYYYVVSATNTNGTSYDSMQLAVSAGLPSSWSNQDVGTVQTAGGSNYSNGVYTIAGSGSDIGSTADSMQYAYHSMTGNDTIIARLVGRTGTGKVGLMMRESLSTNSRHATILHDGSISRFNYRGSTGSSSTWIDGSSINFPNYFKLQRSGNVFTGYSSADGVTWVQIGSATIAMNSTIYVGFAVCSRSPSLTAGTFNLMFTTTGNQAPAITTSASGSMNAGSVTASLSVLGSDDTGEAGLTYSWNSTGPAAVRFSNNENNAAKNVTASFSQAGTYTLTVTVTDPGYLTATSKVIVVVNPVLSSLIVNPSGSSPVVVNQPEKLISIASDQFGGSMNASVIWSVVSGGGTIDTNGLYNASTAGTVTVRAAVGAVSGNTSFNVLLDKPAWYLANSSSGTTLTDSSGSSHNASLTGSYSWVAGKNGNAINLSGGYATLPSGIVNGLNDFTIATWVKLTSLNSWSRIFDFGSGTNLYMFLTPQAGTSLKPRFAIRSNGVSEQYVESSTSLTTGAWQHIAVSLTSTTLTMYINGVAVGSDSFMPIEPLAMGTSSQNYLGKSQFSADPALQGALDDFRIYARGLSASEVQSLYLSPATPTISTAASASPNPAITSTALSVLAADDGGESNLVYTWTTTGSPPAPVTFSINGTNASKNTIAYFSTPGTYTFQVTITDPIGFAATSNVNVNVTAGTITIAGSSGDDNYRLVTNGTNDDIYLNNALTQSINRSLISSINFNGLGGNDSLTIDYINGDPGSVSFDGGIGTDTIDIKGLNAIDTFNLNSSNIITHGIKTVSFTSIDTLAILAGSFIANSNLNNLSLVASNASTAIAFTKSQNLSSLVIDSGAVVSSASSQTSLPAMIVGSVLIDNGLLSIAPNGSRSGVSQFSSLSITGTGRLDLHDNDLIIEYVNNTSPYAAIRNSLMSGLLLLGGSGYGIGSSEVDSQSKEGTILAMLDDGDTNIAGAVTSTSGYAIPNPTTSIIIKFTWFGDSNLDGQVDGSDYALLDSGFTSGGSLGGWVFGDYDYSGVVDGSDYALIDTGFIDQSSAL